MKSFHNTINLDSQRLKKAVQRSVTQDEKILAIFKNYPTKSLSPIEIHTYFKGRILLTSVRRSITNMTRDNLLIKTSKKIDGKYGMTNFTWKLK